MMRSLLFACFLSACATAAPAPTATHEGGYDVLDVTLTLTPDIAAHTIRAEQSMRLRVEQTLQSLRFDANALTLTAATLDGAPLTWTSTDEGLVFAPQRPLRAGHTVTLRFAYHGAPARGLVWEEHGFYTSYFSCDWMICALDRPGDAFQFHADVSAPAGWRSFQADDARAYPAHTQGFAAGVWTEVEQQAGATTLVYASASASAADLTAMLADAPRMLAFFEHAAGMPFPQARYTQLLVAEDEAQEGAGFAILGDGVVRAALTDPHEDWAAAHEMAHQYWGNLITPRDWSHFWLSEGLTTFMVAAWKQQRWGDADYQREIELATRRFERARDAGWDRPLTFPGPYPDLRTRRAIQYSKGMLFFVALRERLGEEAFWAGLSRYTRTHAGGVVESADLQRAMEAASGRNLEAMFSEWVYP